MHNEPLHSGNFGNCFVSGIHYDNSGEVGWHVNVVTLPGGIPIKHCWVSKGGFFEVASELGSGHANKLTVLGPEEHRDEEARERVAIMQAIDLWEKEGTGRDGDESDVKGNILNRRAARNS